MRPSRTCSEDLITGMLASAVRGAGTEDCDEVQGAPPDFGTPADPTV
jgi:hypothetical protein